MDACEEFEHWNGQSEPTVRHQKGKIVPKINDVIGKVSSRKPICISSDLLVVFKML